MEVRTGAYFVSDVHLGAPTGDPKDRERRFVSFLESIPAATTKAVFLLGDIWDFWYEYRDVVPKGNVRLFAALMDLVDAGVEVYFMPGNHDMWNYGYFESMGIRFVDQPFYTEIAGKVFCLGHGDGLGPVPKSYLFMRSLLRSRLLRALFSCLHPRIAFSIGAAWSRKTRSKHDPAYEFAGKDEPLYKFAESVSSERKVDFFIFGHYHRSVQMKLTNGAEFHVLKDWESESPYLYFDGISIFGGHSQKME